MANQVEPSLIPALFEELQSERFVTLATVDHETRWPQCQCNIVDICQRRTNAIVCRGSTLKNRREY